MSYDFRLLFSGLCAFVPDKEGESPDEMTVLLITTNIREDEDSGDEEDAKKPIRMSSIGGELDNANIHQPLLVFDLRGLGYDSGGEGINLGSWVLQKEEVSVHFLRGEYEYPVGGLRVRIDNTDSSFSHVSLVEDAIPEADQVDPECFNYPPGDPVARLISARFRIDKGTLSTAELAQYKAKDILAQFVPRTGAGIPRRFARKVALEVGAIPDDVRVVFRARSLGDPDNPDNQRELVLLPVEDQRQRIVRVEVRNLCCESVLKDKDTEDSPQSDLDFAFYYQIAERYPEIKEKYLKLPVPVPVEFSNDRKDNRQGGGDTIKCSVSRFSAREPRESLESDIQEED